MKTFPVFCIFLAMFSQSLQAPTPQELNVFQTHVNSGNGNLTVTIDGKPVDFEKAKVLSTTEHYTVYQPEGYPNVEITKYKNGGVSINSRGSSNIQITSGNNVVVTSGNNEQVQQYVNQMLQSTMAQLNHALGQLDKNLAATFSNNFPFN